MSEELESGTTQTLEYEDVEDWKQWHAKVAEDLSVVVPKGATGNVTVTVEVEDA